MTTFSISGVSYDLLTSPLERVVPLPLGQAIVKLIVPNWVDSIAVTTIFRTDVARSKLSGNKKARALNSRPVRDVTVSLTSRSKIESEVLLQGLLGLAGQRNSLPLYSDQVYSTGTAPINSDTVIFGDFRSVRFYPGQRVYVLSYDVAKTDTHGFFCVLKNRADTFIVVEGSLPRPITSRDLILPCIDCEIIPSSSGTLLTDSIYNTTVTFEEIQGQSALPASVPAYLPGSLPNFPETDTGYPILNIEPDWTDGVDLQIQRESESYSSGKGTVHDTYSRPLFLFSLNICNRNRQDKWKLLSLFDSMQGRSGIFAYKPASSAWKLRLSLPFPSLSSCFIEAVGTPELASHFKWICFSDGSRNVVRKIDTISISGDYFRILFSSPLPDVSFTSASPIHFCEFSRDSIEEVCLTDGVSTVEASFQEIGNFDLIEASNPQSIPFEGLRIPSSADLANPDLWFESRAGAFSLSPDDPATLERTAVFPAAAAIVTRVYDAREVENRIIPFDAPVSRSYLRPPHEFCGLVKFSESWQNGGNPTLSNGYFDISKALVALEPFTPSESRHLWGTSGWSLIIGVSPFTETFPPSAQCSLLQVVDSTFAPVFELFAARQGGAGPGATGLFLRRQDGSGQTVLFQGAESSFVQMGRSQVFLLVWDAASSVLRVYKDGVDILSPAGVLVPSIARPSSYGWMALGNCFHYSAPPSSAYVGSWGIKGGINAFLSFSRPLVAAEANGIASDLSRSYNGVWNPVSY